MKGVAMVLVHSMLLTLVLAAPPAAPPAAPAADGSVVVRRDGARLMKAPRFWGKSCPGEVHPGDRLRLLERRSGWARVAAPGAGRCWLHESAWSDRAAGELTGDPSRASQREVELAGRGFSEGEEARFRGEHRDLDAAFAAIEAQLAGGAEPSPEAVERFRADGGLEGGAP